VLFQMIPGRASKVRCNHQTGIGNYFRL